MTPLPVTVVVPAFNRAKLITRALESVRRQAVWPEAVIVVDDGSSDGTPDVVQAWAREHNFPARVEHMPSNGGPGAARNLGMQKSTTPYIAFLDSDDEHEPHALSTLVRGLEAAPDAVLAFLEARVIIDGRPSTAGLFTPHLQRLELETFTLGSHPWVRLRNPVSALLRASILPTSGTCFRREVAERVGYMPPGFRSGEDWLFWLRMAQQGDVIGRTDPGVLHHRHDDNLTSARAGAFMANEKLRGFLSLENGSIGVRLQPAQLEQVRQFRAATLQDWRYHQSRLGVRAYLQALRSEPGRAAHALWSHLTQDPRSFLRAVAATVSGGALSN